MKDLKKFRDELPLREGAHAIYIEPPGIAYVRVSDVQADENYVSAVITIVPTPGMQADGENSYEIGAAWDIFSNWYDHWHASYVNWSVYFGADEIKAGLELAARAAEKDSCVKLREMRSALEKIQSARWKAAMGNQPSPPPHHRQDQ
jgi:hypothetical protein